MNIKIHKTLGKHPNIGWWFIFAIVPCIAIGRTADFIKKVPVYGVHINWLFWQIEINNNKSY